MAELCQWEASGVCSPHHIGGVSSRSTPESALDHVLEEAQLVYGDQDWSQWMWWVVQHGSREISGRIYFRRTPSGTWERVTPG